MPTAKIAIHRVGNAAELRLIEGDLSILSALYAFDVAEAPPEDLLVTYEPFLQDPIARIREVLESVNRNGASYELTSVEGDTLTIEGEGPPLAVTIEGQGPADPEKIEEIHVDLRWSLWTASPADFGDSYPEALARMKAAFEGRAPAIKIYTAPKKEIRYGNVLVKKGRAEVYFSYEWDDPQELADFVNEFLDTELTEAEHRQVSEQIADWLADQYDEFREEAAIEADTFDALMAKIDAVEDRLLTKEKELSEAIKGFEKSLAAWITDVRAHPEGDQ